MKNIKVRPRLYHSSLDLAKAQTSFVLILYEIQVTFQVTFQVIFQVTLQFRLQTFVANSYWD